MEADAATDSRVSPGASESTAPRALCPSCGYDVRGGGSRVCPECGFDLDGDIAVRVRSDRVPGVRLFWAVLIVFLVVIIHHAVYVGLLIAYLLGQPRSWVSYHSRLHQWAWERGNVALAVLTVAVAVVVLRTRSLRASARHAALPLAGLVVVSFVGWLSYQANRIGLLGSAIEWQPLWFVNEFRARVLPSMANWIVFWPALWWPLIAVGSLHWIIPVTPADRLGRWKDDRDPWAALWLLVTAVAAAAAGGFGRNASTRSLAVVFAVFHGTFVVSMFFFGLSMSKRLIAGRNLFNRGGQVASIVSAVRAYLRGRRHGDGR